jgi:hypothetical protein
MEKNFAQLKEEFQKVVGNPPARDLAFDILMKHRLENDEQRCEIARVYIEKEFSDVLSNGIKGGTVEVMKRFDDFLTWQEKTGLSKYEPDHIRNAMRDKIAESFNNEFDKINQAAQPYYLSPVHNILSAIQSPPATMRPLMPGGFRTRLLDASLQIIQNAHQHRLNLNLSDRNDMLAFAKKVADAGAAIDAKPSEPEKSAVRYRIVDDGAPKPQAGAAP